MIITLLKHKNRIFEEEEEKLKKRGKLDRGI